MFAMMSQFSRDEFVHLINNMHANPSLKAFRERVQHARKTYIQLQSHVTAK